MEQDKKASTTHKESTEKGWVICT